MDTTVRINRWIFILLQWSLPCLMWFSCLLSGYQRVRQISAIVRVDLRRPWQNSPTFLFSRRVGQTCKGAASFYRPCSASPSGSGSQASPPPWASPPARCCRWDRKEVLAGKHKVGWGRNSEPSGSSTRGPHSLPASSSFSSLSLSFLPSFFSFCNEINRGHKTTVNKKKIQAQHKKCSLLRAAPLLFRHKVAWLSILQYVRHIQSTGITQRPHGARFTCCTHKRVEKVQKKVLKLHQSTAANSIWYFLPPLNHRSSPVFL